MEKEKSSKTIMFFKKIIKTLTTKEFWVNLGPSTGRFIVKTSKNTRSLFEFFILLIVFFTKKFLTLFKTIPLINLVIRILPINLIVNALNKIAEKIDSNPEVKRIYLIELAFNNMKLKKTRSIITIGGMALGIGVIVLLLSLGYGLEKLVINRVARLDDLKMADVVLGESSTLRLNYKTLDKISKIKNVKDVVPIISIVGRVKYHNAMTDILSYAVPQKYLNYSQVKTSRGKIFDNNEISMRSSGQVAGAKTETIIGQYGAEISSSNIDFNLIPSESAPVWTLPAISSKIMGYTKRIEGGFTGKEYWGETYYSLDGNGYAGYDEDLKMDLGKWVKGKFPLYQKRTNGELFPILDDLGRPLWDYGYVASKNTQITPKLETPEVLGESIDLSSTLGTESATASDSASLSLETGRVSTGSSGIEWVDLTATETASINNKKMAQIMKFETKPIGEALVTTSMLTLLNIPVDKALNQEFKVSFILGKSLMPEIDKKIFSEEVNYRITGVIDDNNLSYFYVPLVDMSKLGVSNYSQVRVVANRSEDLSNIRKSIEIMGFRTSSTVDTVAQIEKLFGNLRLLLGFLGLVALAVAVLGMFNTLTVSLLERTKEIGGMKAMGLLSSEVNDLFQAEAMILGFSGGILGLVFGILGGKLLSLSVSIMALFKGQGLLNLTYVPVYFSLFIVVSSFVVSLITGYYPAKRATKISALDALRYE